MEATLWDWINDHIFKQAKYIEGTQTEQLIDSNPQYLMILSCREKETTESPEAIVPILNVQMHKT